MSNTSIRRILHIAHKWFKYYSRSVRSTIITIWLAVTAVVVIIYLLTKIWQGCKQRRNLAVAPLNIANHHPCLNNVQFNSIIVRSKTFLFLAISCLMILIICFILYELKLTKMYTKYNEVQVLLINLNFSIVVPLNIYLKNPSLRKYVRKDLLNDLC